jgi:hypothetical protein
VKRRDAPAFPVIERLTHVAADDTVHAQGPAGMTLREYAAIAVMGRCIEVAAQFVIESRGFEAGTVGLTEVVRRAAGMAAHSADALLAELAKPTSTKPDTDAAQAALRG